MTSSDSNEGGQDPGGIREHDKDVLEFLSRNPSLMMGFQGLKRRLGIHPEQLSRALKRLSSDGLVEQTELGYRVTVSGLSLLNVEITAEEPPGFTVIQAHMPADADVRRLVGALKGSWIGPLRWQGFAESIDGLKLVWTTEDGKVIMDARIQGGLLTVSAHVNFQERIDEAIRLGHMLFQHLAQFSTHDDRGSLTA